MDLASELNKPFDLNGSAIEFFRESGFIKLKEVFSPVLLEHFGDIISAKVLELNEMHLPMEERTTYQKAFLQVMNIWTKDESVRQFVFGQRLARIAAELMGTKGVRIYHDQAPYKEPGGGITPWHADQYYWPLASDKVVTAWVPLDAVPIEMGPISFAAKSHRFPIGRDLEISDESEELLRKELHAAEFEYVIEPFELGEVSFHSGWTFHNAGPNRSDKPRQVMTVIYIDEQMRLAEPQNESQQDDREAWCPGAEVGEIIDTPLNPIVYWETFREGEIV